MREIRIIEPFTKEKFSKLKMGDNILLSGTIYTARDSAHKKIMESIEKGEKLPFDMENAIVYYVGPTPEREGQVIGSAGPTTSYRMDLYTPKLIELGQLATIGKGNRSDEVVEAIKKNGAVYLAAIGGAGALISQTIISKEVIAYDELGPEAVNRLIVKDMPVIVAIDSNGNDIYRKEEV